LFDSTDYPNPEGEEFNSDKVKEQNLNARPFDDSKLKVSFKDEDVFDAFDKSISEYQPDLILMSCTEDLHPIGMDLLEKVNVKKFGIPVQVGGVFPTFAPEIVISHPQVDMVCRGEGEYVVSELADRIKNGLPYDDIPGLWIKSGDKIIRNSLPPLVDIDNNPFLDLSIFAEGRLYRPMQGKVWRMFPLETHRGCPYTCTYCNSPSQQRLYQNEIGEKFFRMKSIDRIREEIIYFIEECKAEAFYLWADTFLSLPEKKFNEYVEMYSEFNLPFWCQSRPELIKSEKIKKLMDIGLFRMAVGIEHGNEEFRRSILRRNVSNKKIIDSMQVLTDLELPYSVNNIIGFPYETRELTFDTIELNRKHQAEGINAYSFSPFHGTPLRDISEKAGFIDPCVIARSVTKPTLLRMPQYTPEQIEGMRRCFVLYVKFPKDRWSEIEKAEKFTPEGNEKWSELINECQVKYMDTW